MARTSPPQVWYAAYGSNIEAARLAYYVHGGTHPLTGRVTPGCRDGRWPEADAAAEIGHGIVFARRSLGWDGAIAFLDPDRPGHAHTRLWKLTAEQFIDIVAQENTRQPGSIDASIVAALGPSVLTAVALPGGWYGRLVWCGERDGLPIVSCTADWDLSTEAPAPPSPAYLATVARGLRECGHPAESIAAYLSALPGTALDWDEERILTLLDT